MARVLFVVNADWFFISHRLGLAKAIRAAGHEVEVCAGQSEAHRRIEAEGFPFHALPIDRGGTHPLRDSRTLAALLALYARRKPDLVHHVTIKPVLYGSSAARMLGVRAVVNAVSGLGYAFIPREGGSLRHSLLGYGLKAAYRLALSGRRTRVIFQNEDDRSAFVRDGLVQAERTRLIRGSGVDLERFQATPLPGAPFVALMPSRLLWDKGVGEFVEAARRLKPRFPTARFVLAGRLDYDNPAALRESEVAAWVKEGVVEWWPDRESDDMPAVYAAAHVIVLPSYREGLPLALAEAAASGRPVLTTDTPGCRDTVLDGDSGFLVPVRDSTAIAQVLERCLSTTPDLGAMGRSGRRLAEERFDRRRVVAQTLATYSELLGS